MPDLNNQTIPDFQTTDIPPIPHDNDQPPIVNNQTVGNTSVGTPAPVSSDLSAMITPPPKKKFGGGKIIATILGLLVLVGGIGAGILLTGQGQDIREKATGDNYRKEIKCPKPAGQSGYRWCLVENVGNCTGGPISCDDPSVDWENGPGCEPVTEPCGGGGGGGGGGVCRDLVKAYNTGWNQLNASQLSALKAGNKVRFTIPSEYRLFDVLIRFEKARFTINGITGPVVTDKKPGSNEYFYEYTIPASTTSFNVQAEVFFPGRGWIK